MSKEYRYRKFIRWGQYAIPVFWGLLLLFLLVPMGSLYLLIGLHIDSIFMVIFIVEILVFLLAGVGAWYLYYRLAGVSVSIDSDGVVYKYRGGQKRLPFESLRMDSSSIRYTGGWLKLISGKDVIRLTVVVEGISSFVQELKTALDSRGLSDHYDPQKLFGFIKTAVASDQSWERLYIVFGKLYLSIFVVCITLVNGYIFGTIQWGIIFIVVWGIFSLFWATGAYVVAEIVLMRKIAKESNEKAFTFPQRDPAYEKKVFNDAINWGGGCTLGFNCWSWRRDWRSNIFSSCNKEAHHVFNGLLPPSPLATRGRTRPTRVNPTPAR